MEDAVEAALPYNCEHLVPQIWFGKAEPMRDLLHLFACETRCNSFRGNTLYAELADFPDLDGDGPVRSDCDKSESNGFRASTRQGSSGPRRDLVQARCR